MAPDRQPSPTDSRSSRCWPPVARLLLFVGLLLGLGWPAPGESALMNLPDGIENILGFVPKSTFKCERDGYFGDIDNDCRLFHLCQRDVNAASGRLEWRHWTYACGNQTMFNQLTLTCAFVDEAIPCKHASQFQYLNEVIHKPAEPFLTDADVTSGFSYYSNRVMSDGARARAFQDSQLLAQIGGQSEQQSSGAGQRAEESRESAANELAANFLRDTFQPTSGLVEQSSAADFRPALLDSAQNFRQLGPAQDEHFSQAERARSQQQLSAPPQVQRPHPVSGPNSFEFSIATDHRDFASAPVASFEQSFTSAPQRATSFQNLGAFRNAHESSPQQVDLQTQFSSRPPTAPTTPTSTTVNPGGQFQTASSPQSTTPTTTTTTLPTTAGPAEAQTVAPLNSTTTLPPPVFASSQRLQLTQPIASTTSSPQLTSPTTVASSSASTTASAARGVQPGGSATQSQPRRATQPGGRQLQQARRSSELSSFERAHVGFQSTRLSGANKRVAPGGDTPLVMRRSLRTPSQPVAGSGVSPQSQPKSPQLLSPSPASLLEAPGADFWRRPFDAQLTFAAPKFESLLMRRRV